MKFSFRLLISLCLISTLLAADANGCTGFTVDMAVYNLCPLATNAEFTSTLTPLVETVAFTLGTAHLKSCDNSKDEWARINGVVPPCTDIATTEPSYSNINDTEPGSGLVVTFPPQNDNQLVVTLTCNEDGEDNDQIAFETTSDTVIGGKRVIQVKGATKHACPVFSYNQILNWIHAHRKIFAGIFGVLGLVLTFFGLKLFAFTQFIIATVLGTLLLSSILFAISGVVTAVWASWVIIIVSIIFGIGMGYLAVKYWKVSYFIVGSGLGLIGGIVLYNAVIYPFVEGKAQVVLYVIVLIICGLAAACLAIWIGRKVIMAATAVIGSYLVVRAISVWAGGFPSEGDVLNGFRHFNGVVYAYLVGIIVLACVGFFVQKKMDKEDKDDRAPHYNRV